MDMVGGPSRRRRARAAAFRRGGRAARERFGLPLGCPPPWASHDCPRGHLAPRRRANSLPDAVRASHTGPYAGPTAHLSEHLNRNRETPKLRQREFTLLLWEAVDHARATRGRPTGTSPASPSRCSTPGARSAGSSRTARRLPWSVT